MADLFHFKQFDVDQSGCGMKINTDGVLLGALVQSVNPTSILDVGTGTGVIAMMLAQRFPEAMVDAIEIDASASATALKNFQGSCFSDRLQSFSASFQDFSSLHPEKKYDLIVSNPPFFTNSMKNPDHQKQLARHASKAFFVELVQFVQCHLTYTGVCYLILPVDISSSIQQIALNMNLAVCRIVNIRSSISKIPHRQLIGLRVASVGCCTESFTIYESEKRYSNEYRMVLKDLLTIF